MNNETTQHHLYTDMKHKWINEHLYLEHKNLPTVRTPLSYICNGIQPADKPIEHLIKSDKISFLSSFVSVLSVMAYNQQISQ